MHKAAALTAGLAATIHRIGFELLLQQGYQSRTILAAHPVGLALLWIATLGVLVWAALAMASKTASRGVVMVIGAIATLAIVRGLASASLPLALGGAWTFYTLGWWVAVLAGIAATYLFVRAEKAG